MKAEFRGRCCSVPEPATEPVQNQHQLKERASEVACLDNGVMFCQPGEFQSSWQYFAAKAEEK